MGSREEDEAVVARRQETFGTFRQQWRAELGDGGEEEVRAGDGDEGERRRRDSAGGRVRLGEKVRGAFCKSIGAQLISGRREYHFWAVSNCQNYIP
jgi:hypothetical protein